MTDLTKITTPFGLLDAETQEALRAHGGPLEIYTMNGWRDWQGFMINGVEMAFPKSSVVRVKPQPHKQREWWIVKISVQNFLYESRATAYAVAQDRGGELIHVREVLE